MMAAVSVQGCQEIFPCHAGPCRTHLRGKLSSDMSAVALQLRSVKHSLCLPCITKLLCQLYLSSMIASNNIFHHVQLQQKQSCVGNLLTWQIEMEACLGAS